MDSSSGGPLRGIRVLEIGGMGPTPFVGMMLADMGADVIRVERPGGLGVFPGDDTDDVLNRGKRMICLDLKHSEARSALLKLVERSDVVVEGGRPGVAERLGYGPAQCHERLPGLVYGRMTGWGQSGPLSLTAGHDINYIAITGALHAIGTVESPIPPLNLVGDFGGGAMYLVSGILAALFESKLHGVGQVVDASIVDGASHLLASVHALVNTGTWKDQRYTNMLDGGSPDYAVYRTLDDGHIAVGALEEKFYLQLLNGLGLEPSQIPDRADPEQWPALRQLFAGIFLTETRAHWEQVFHGTDACVAPVLSLHDAATHPHIASRGAVLNNDGYLQPGIAPRFSAHTPRNHIPRARKVGSDTRTVLSEAGLDADSLIHSGAARVG